uniref:ARAD1D00814p n=1 Tax=Blastobotrys adeninivorans TaxID=409370 RepID=A0A060TDJ6_BLAAD
MESILSQYLLEQTSLRELVSYSQFKTLCGSSINSGQARKLYHALIHADYERQQEIARNVQQYTEELEEQPPSEDSTTAFNGPMLINRNSLPSTTIDQDTLDEYAAQLEAELERRVDQLQQEVKKEIELISDASDSLNDLRHGSPAIGDSVSQAHEQLDSLHSALNTRLQQ